MKLDFIKNTKKGIVAGIIARVVALFFPFLNRTLFLMLLGPKYLGLNGLFASILGVLSLAELGFGTAIVCSMYKPIADDDRELVCSYLNFYRTIYRWIGTAIFLIGLCLMPFLRQLVHGNLPPDVDLHILYLLHLINTSVSYFLFAYRGVIISAHQRHDVTTNIGTLISLMQYIVVFAVLALTRNYYLYVITTIFFTVARNLLIMRASKRLFPDIAPRGELAKDKRNKVAHDVKAIFMHKIGTVISYSIDNVLLSAFIGLEAVATYGNYYYVYTAIAGIPSIVYTSMTGGFGNRIHTESREENFKLLMRVYRLVGLVIIWCAAMMLALYQPFIKVWMGHRYATLALHFLTPALLVLYFYINQSRQVLLTYKAAAGLWKEDQWKPVVGGAVKLTSGLALIAWLPPEYKLDGVILSSIIGYILIQIPWESNVVFTKFFDRQQKKTYWGNQAFMVLAAIAPCAIALTAVRLIPMEGLPGLAVKAAVAAVLVSTLVVATFRRDVLDLLGILLRKR